MVDYNKLVLNSTIYLIEGNEDIVKNEEAGFISSNNIFVNNQYMILLKTAFENIGLFDEKRRQNLITIYNKIIGSYNYIKETKVPIKDFTIKPDNIEMLVGEIVDVYITCIPELTTDANKIAIYNPSNRICTVKQIDVKNNIVHLTIIANDNGNSEIEITGGSVLKKLNVVVNY